MTVQTHVVEKSGNAKLGVMSATYRTMASCPSSCAFYDNGCYAKGRIFGIPAKYGREDMQKVRDLAVSMPIGGALRINVSGDYLLDDSTPDHEYIEAINFVVRERPDVRIISYTHAWRDLSPALFDFTVNASCETAEDVEKAIAAGWQAVIVDDGSMLGEQVAGRRVAQCPQQYRPGVTCASCMACASDKGTRPVIAFVAHGSGAKKATVAVQGRRA